MKVFIKYFLLSRFKVWGKHCLKKVLEWHCRLRTIWNSVAENSQEYLASQSHIYSVSGSINGTPGGCLFGLRRFTLVWRVDTFYHKFTRRKHLNWVIYFSYQLTYLPVFKYQCYFRYLLNFLLVFQFWITNKHLHCLRFYNKLHFIM